MYPIGIVGPGPEIERSVRDRLVQSLRDDGRVGVIERTSTVMHPADGITVEYSIGEDGWTATGLDGDIEDVIEDLAPTCEYVLVLGWTDPNIPTIVIDGAGSPPKPLLEVETPADVTVSAVKEAVMDTEPVVTLESLVEEVKAVPDADKAGAIATFTGRVRGLEHDDDTPTTHLEFEKYAGVAGDQLDTIQSDLEQREGVYAVAMHHRTGVIEAGQDIVFVVVLAGHREEAFDTVEDGINRLKAEVPIFKKEVTLEETYWVHNA